AAENPVPLGTIRSFWIGDGSGPYDGRLDDFAVWSRALSAADIAGLAGGESPLKIGHLTSRVKTDLAEPMHGVNASAWIRFPFAIDGEPTATELDLTVRYDDGFIAYVNGTPVARRNAPEPAPWNAAATEKRSSGAASEPERIPISVGAALLRPGP